MSDSQTSKPPSERSFGTLFFAVFSAIGIYGNLKGWVQSAWVAWFTASVLVGLVTLLSPKLLAPLNKTWFLFGELLGKIISPIVLGVIFFGLVTPVAFFARVFGRDELRLKRQTASSYWIDRAPPSPAPDSFKNQF